jgi:2-C-methyl-D-erythritol 4-phosphate cytidylyltransferase
VRAAIVVAGGSGERFGRPGGKQLALVGGVAVVGHAVAAVASAETVDLVVLVCHPDRVGEYSKAVDGLAGGVAPLVVAGGETRRLSVAAGLAAVPDDATVIVVHDGARPLVEPDVVDSAVRMLEDSGADGVVVGHPAYDTMKVVDERALVCETPDRSTLWVAQTPQVFTADALRRAHRRAAEDGFDGTDDASLVERIGGRVLMHEGPRWNIKVTVPEDLRVVEALLADRKDEKRRD